MPDELNKNLQKRLSIKSFAYVKFFNLIRKYLKRVKFNNISHFWKFILEKKKVYEKLKYTH